MLELDPTGLRLQLPRLDAAQLAAVWPGGGFGPPSTEPGLTLHRLRPSSWRRDVRRGRAGGLSIRDVTDSGAWSTEDRVGAAERALDRYSLVTDTGTEAEVLAWREVTLGRADWEVRVVVSSRLRADPDHFHLTSRVRAFEGPTLIWDRSRRQQVPRHGI